MTDVLGDIQRKYEDGFQFLQARKKRQANQLKLLVNLQRGDQNIASTLLLTLFNRVMSSIYDDKLQVKFLPSQGINQDQINAYNILAQSDYQEMNKAKLDYDWVWDTLFYGRGYMETLRFNMKKKLMEPHVINPLAFGYDPIVHDPQEWRFYWKWITKNKWELQKLIKKGKLEIKSLDEIASGVDPYLWQYKQITDQARDAVIPSPEPYSKDVFQILEIFTYDDEGDKCVYWTDKNFSVILMHEKLEKEDDEVPPWPIIVKESYRQPHSSIPFSVADLLDDKHRAKSVLLNLAFIAAKDIANPVYLYNSEKVDDVTQFLSRQINQHIPVSDVATAVAPLNKAHAFPPELMSFFYILQNEAGEPVGSGIPMRPISGGNRMSTASEVAIDQQLNNMAQSLLSKVMQFGESEFWSHWFRHYALNADALDSKMANIVGVKGVETKEIDMSLFHSDFPPGVFVYSAKEAQDKELTDRRDLMQIYPEMAQTLDADGMRNFNKHVFFPKFLQDPSLVDVVFPKTLDELKAEDENERLSQGEMVDVQDTDNHITHIYTHKMAMPKTWELWAHIEWHQELLAQQKQQPGGQGQSKGPNVSISLKGDLSPQLSAQLAGGSPEEAAEPEQPQAPPQALGGPGQVGVQKQSPMANATPLKTELQSNIQQNG